MQVPFKEMLKSIPGAVGIRLERELPYTVVKKIEDHLEIRQYPAFTLARTSASGDYDSVTETCFKRLAEFIFGKNSQNKITEMTTPVFMDRKGSDWVMSFYIPEEYVSLSPKDSSIKIEQKPTKQVAVYSYSGNVTQESMEKAKEQLLSLIAKNHLKAVSDVWWAQYDQPMSLPFTKRNEVFVKVENLS